jgi:hypothetical protein
MKGVATSEKQLHVQDVGHCKGAQGSGAAHFVVAYTSSLHVLHDHAAASRLHMLCILTSRGASTLLH